MPKSEESREHCFDELMVALSMGNVKKKLYVKSAKKECVYLVRLTN